MATADVPQGPFRQEVKQPIWDEKSIDTSLFIDDDGTPYLYFVRFTDGNVIWVAEMNDDLTGIKQETLTECITAGRTKKAGGTDQTGKWSVRFYYPDSIQWSTRYLKVDRFQSG